MLHRPRFFRVVALVSGVCLALVSTPAGAEEETPESYAAATFEAWLQHDPAQLEHHAAPPVAAFLLARKPQSPVGWTNPVCEGAVGSTYCTWERPETQLVLRVANEPASTGQPHAVTNAAFEPAGTNVAVWPFTAAEQAEHTQAKVDQGNEPWLLDPAVVSYHYANAIFGWTQPIVRLAAPGTYWVTDPHSGTMSELKLSQPVRQDNTGIWAVNRAASIPLG